MVLTLTFYWTLSSLEKREREENINSNNKRCILLRLFVILFALLSVVVRKSIDFASISFPLLLCCCIKFFMTFTKNKNKNKKFVFIFVFQRHERRIKWNGNHHFHKNWRQLYVCINVWELHNNRRAHAPKMNNVIYISNDNQNLFSSIICICLYAG